MEYFGFIDVLPTVALLSISKKFLNNHFMNMHYFQFQVVVAMRDLFQVVFELKQKEIDDALRKMDKDKRVSFCYLSFLQMLYFF